jgi:hypothetical protein
MRPTTIQDERRQLRTLMNMNRGFVKSIDAYALVLVLLATVTYPTFSQPPGSFDDDGLMRTSCNPPLLWFVYLNSFSFFFSMTDLLLCISGKYAPMGNLLTGDLKVERGDPKTQEGGLVKFNDKLAQSVLFTLTKLLVINVLFVLSLTCCIAAYISAGSAVQQLPISNRLSIIIPGIGGCLLYFVFVVWLFLDFALFFSFARSDLADSDLARPGSIVDCFTDFCTLIWFFLFRGGSSCTQKRFEGLAKNLAEAARLWSVQQLFNKASDEIICYDQNTPHELNAAEQTSQQQQQRSTETSNNNAAAAAAFRAQQSADNNNAAASSPAVFRPLTSQAAVNAVELQQQQAPARRRPARIPNSQDFPSFRDQTSVPISARSRVQELGKFETPDDDKESEEEEEGGEGHGPEAEADLHGPVANSRTSLGVRCSSFRCSTCYGIPCECRTGLPQL